MRPSLRKTLAQVGVVLYAAQFLDLVFESFPTGEYSALLFLLSQSWLVFFIAAAVLPANDQDTWGSMWPLVGYDNAIDAIYTRGPWWVRFQELEDQERERRVTDGMSSLFAA